MGGGELIASFLDEQAIDEFFAVFTDHVGNEFGLYEEPRS
jgi:dihydrofolate reductase